LRQAGLAVFSETDSLLLHKKSFIAARFLFMKRVFKKIYSYELFLLLLLAAFTLLIGLANPKFFSLPTLFDILRNNTTYILVALGLLPVVILGGFDVSFGAIATFAAFLARHLLSTMGYEGGIWLLYIVSVAFGILIGALVSWLVWRFKPSIFDLSLGMSSLIAGIMAFLSTVLPGGGLPGLKGWSMNWLVTIYSESGRSGLHVSIYVLVAAVVFLTLFLRFTTLGRTLYAVGSDKSVAVRTGVSLRLVYFTAYALLGAFGALASTTGAGFGMGSGAYGGNFMRIYAMVIIGGASIFGGKGTAIGTVLGVLLVGLINQALVYLDVPVAWGDLVLALFFLSFTAYRTIENRFEQNQPV
jgi:simple sugar transport system permease protein